MYFFTSVPSDVKYSATGLVGRRRPGVPFNPKIWRAFKQPLFIPIMNKILKITVSFQPIVALEILGTPEFCWSIYCFMPPRGWQPHSVVCWEQLLYFPFSTCTFLHLFISGPETVRQKRFKKFVLPSVLLDEHSETAY